MRIKKITNFLIWILPGDIVAISIFPFGVYVRQGQFSYDTISHEIIHWQQQKEMLCLFFYLWYVLEWLLKFPKYKHEAYYNISMEREAYALPERRKHYGWVKYIFNKTKNK
jgi:hypothetical protein